MTESRCAVIVVGADTAVGSAVATNLAERADVLALVGRQTDDLDAVGARLAPAGIELLVRAGDAGDVAFGESVVDAALARADRLSVVVDVLVREDPGGSNETTDPWPNAISSNIRSLYAFARPAVAGMRETGGRIVLVTSRAWIGERSELSTSAIAAAATGFARALALEAGRFGITVNVVAPAYVDTPEWRSRRPDQAVNAERATAVRRPGTAGEVAAAVAFLASNEAGFITGQTLSVCGGSSIGKALF